ncbi:hypothetical protein ARAM_004944 [Aspergillus rambellii]|uniref:Uncharacterized protein n=1 Tax=Aspergillus rambellii TaxID=308745 RepID=A0A0F8UJP6_9EURO|nr:hypothetical protein ARAM_004944 [Aspergillus rambellii]
MSPAPLAADVQPGRQLKILARAFEALLLTTQQLSTKEKLLETRLKYAADEVLLLFRTIASHPHDVPSDEKNVISSRSGVAFAAMTESHYLKLSCRLPEGRDSHAEIVSERILDRHYEFDSPRKQKINLLDVVKDLAESGNVGDSSLAAITAGVECYKTFLDTQDDNKTSDPNPGLVATRAGSLEKDFTTKGTRGSLRCPFAKPHNKPSENGVTNGIENALPSQNGDSCGIEHLDPIKAEQLDRQSTQTPSARSSTTRCPVSRCPIRFLDQHSPEEIADYVERHKHEIPRSHAICVKRYSNSSRQLDAKYGDLTNMIRGLSQKHQAFLPGRDRSQTTSSSVERVEKWAEEVGLKSEMQPSIKEEEEENEEERKGHFDRPMREVRVGESPSRPWGIHVPVPLPPVASESAQNPAADLVESSADTQSNKNATADGPRKVGRCPFGHGGAAPPPDHPAIETETIRKEDKPSRPKTPPPEEKEENPANPPGVQVPLNGPTVVINGPVFFGFSAEHTATFMQQLASMGINKL